MVITIFAIRYENCADNWKHKGRYDFQLNIEDMLSTDVDIRDILRQMVAEQSTQYERFEYLDHIIYTDRQLSENRFIAIANNLKTTEV